MAKKAKKSTGRGSALTKKCNLSDQLAEFMGKDKASRSEVTKAVWAYIKENDLQDPDDKRTICPDDELGAIIGHSRINMMKMTGAISKHIESIED